MYELPYNSETMRWILLKLLEKNYYVAYRFSMFYLTLNISFFFNYKQFWTQIFSTIVLAVTMEVPYTP